MPQSVTIRGSVSLVSVETRLIDGNDTVEYFAARALSGFAPNAGLNYPDQVAASAIAVEDAVTIDNVTYPGVEITYRDFVVRAAAIDSTRLVAACSPSGPSPMLTWTQS